MSNRKQIVNDAGYYSVVYYLADLIGAFTGILVRRVLGPTMMGIWTALTVFLGYCLYGNLGINGALFKEIPFLMGKGQAELAQETQNIIFTFTLAIGTVLSVLIFIGSFIVKSFYPPVAIAGLRAVAVIVFLTFIYNFLLVSGRAYKKFIFLSKLAIVNEICMLVFVAALVLKFNIYGIFAAVILTLIINITYALWYLKPRLHMQFEKKRLFYLIRLGFSLVIWGVALNTVLSMDKIMAIKLLGAKALGFYSIAIMVFMFAFGAAKRFGTVMFPVMQEIYGASNQAASLEKYVIKPNLILSYLLPFFLGFFYLFVPVAVHYILPKYIEGIPSFKILMIGCFFVSLTPMLYSFLVAIDKQIKLSILTMISIAITVTLSLLFVRHYNMGIEGIATAATISYFSFFLILAFYCSAHFGIIKKFLLHLFSILVPFIVSVSAMLIIDNYVRMGHIIGDYIVKQILFTIAVLPLLFYINKKTNVIRDIWIHLVIEKFKYFKRKEFV